MKLVMTLLVRDEEDVIDENLRFHLEGGVDHFIVTDNGSVDGTRDALRPYERQGLVTLLHQPGDDFSQFRWVTHMARAAATDHGADWVINNDADEFWFGIASSLTDTLEQIPARYGVVTAARSNLPPTPDDGRPFYERMVYRDLRSVNGIGEPLQPKVCHRAHPAVSVRQGNHAVEGVELLTWNGERVVDILHAPARTFAQFERSVVTMGAAYGRNTELPASTGSARRALYRLHQEGGLREYYDSIVLRPERVSAGLTSGRLIEDSRLVDVLLTVRPRR